MVVPQSKPFRSWKILGAFGRDSSPETSSSRSGNLDESVALSSLKELIAAGDHRLDPILATITDAARQLTGASGAALAMWKEGAMVCRARSGDTAPALGAQLGAETGISGECLRTGKIQHCSDTENDPLVDVEVCRSLGLRSIAVLPIQGRRGINGILEVFSTHPVAFTEQHLALLQQLAELAERARASQPHGASSALPKLPVETPQPSRLLPASDRVGDVALASLGTRSRPFALGAIGLVAISLLALVIWLGWRGPDKADGKAHAAKPSSVGTTTVNAVTAHSPDKHPPDNDPLWKANPGGESLFPSSGKTSAGTPVKFASKVDVVAGKKTPTDGAAVFTITHEVPRSQIGSHNASRSIDSPADETVSTEPPSISAGSTNQAALNGVLSAKVSLPGLSALVSQGVSGGQPISGTPLLGQQAQPETPRKAVQKFAPRYPEMAKAMKLSGTVRLVVKVAPNGNVVSAEVLSGHPLLAQVSIDAVRQWRFEAGPQQTEEVVLITFQP